jgi:hypothetical protein
MFGSFIKEEKLKVFDLENRCKAWESKAHHLIIIFFIMVKMDI